MIEVGASLVRGPVFLAGETLQCNITFTNTNSLQDGPDSVSWASVQIHCQCSVSESKVYLVRSHRLSSSDVSTTGGDTSFTPNKGERGLTVLSTKPKILFCDMRLDPGESKTYTYKETIPSDAPPSFKGQAVKYSYKITIGTQRLNHPIKLIRVPFRVMVLYGLNDLSVYTDGDEVTPANPFLKVKENSVLDIGLQILATVTARKSPHSYNVTNARGKVAKCILFKQAYKLGEDMIGIMDFSEGTVPCVQFSVTLQSEEQISEECRKKPNQGSAVTSYVKHQDTCLHTLKTHFSIPVPLTATPGFITDIVCQRWRLHFEFVTSTEPIKEPERPTKPDETATWQGPATVTVETMVWDLPIKMFPANPLHVSSVTLLKAVSGIHI